jgi:hypothetical protein
MRMKAQDLLSTAKAERTHQILIPYTSKSIALTQTDVDHRKIGKKFRPPRLESGSRTYTPIRDYHPRGDYSK